MSKSLRQLVVPVYLFLCLILGGSPQSVWGVLGLQILAIIVIGWAIVFPASDAVPQGRGLLGLLVALLIVISLQLIPLPPGLWTELPGREDIKDGYRALGQQLPWLPISLTPYETLEGCLPLLPPTAVILAVLRLRAYKETWAAAALFAGTLAGILLGYLQVSAGRFGLPAWYLYEYTNVGSAVGFFANRNHMGTLLLIAFPFVVAMFFVDGNTTSRRTTPSAIIGAAGVMTILLGIAVNGSLAAVALAVPVIAASALLIRSLRRFRAVLVAAVAVGLVGALIFLADSPVQPKLTGETTSSFEGRWEDWGLTWTAIERSFPVGTGFGSFERVIATIEPAQDVTLTYINHAHNDYLELLLEGGIPAAILVVAFLVWWLGKSGRALAPPVLNPFAGAAAVASGAVLAHSVVDYPLRTTAIAAIFAFCLAVLAARALTHSSGAARSDPELWPTRHVKVP